MSALQLWLQNHNRKLTQAAIDEALMEYITLVEKQRDELLAELLRVKEICLRECGVGIVNEVVIARAKGGAA